MSEVSSVRESALLVSGRVWLQGPFKAWLVMVMGGLMLMGGHGWPDGWWDRTGGQLVGEQCPQPCP